MNPYGPPNQIDRGITDTGPDDLESRSSPLPELAFMVLFVVVFIITISLATLGLAALE
ncbi:MAG: hypothetical protein AAF664_02585 [Planctomycetota bacterium]